MGEAKEEKKSPGKKEQLKEDVSKRKEGKVTKYENAKNNPKAFIAQSSVKAMQLAVTRSNLQVKKHHMPIMNRLDIDEPPPAVVAVVGPNKVGKSSLISSLIKHYTKHPIKNITGPVTVAVGKKKRVTFIEVSGEMHAMIDAAKVADVVLLVVDASFGFEMETFEFLNIAQTHGFPKVFGVMTHLDAFRSSSLLQSTKKKLKDRFWTEICEGSKISYLNGIVGGRYTRKDIAILAQRLAAVKFKPLSWKNSHPYLLVDRIENLTKKHLKRPADSLDTYQVAMYGYCRGTSLRDNTKVHIPGLGDMSISHLSLLPDPVPLPDTSKLGRLGDKQRILYGPMSEIGDVMIDDDAVYMDIYTNKKENSPTNLLNLDAHEDIDQGENASAAAPSHDENDSDGNMEVGDHSVDMEEEVTSSATDKRHLPLFSKSKGLSFLDKVAENLVHDPVSGRKRRKAVFHDKNDHAAAYNNQADDHEEIAFDDDSNNLDHVFSELEPSSHSDNSDEHNSSSENDSDEDNSANEAHWKEGLFEKATLSHAKAGKKINLMQLVYHDEGLDINASKADCDGEDSLFVRRNQGKSIDDLDCWLEATPESFFEDGPSDEALSEQLRNMFVTGDWGDLDALKALVKDKQASDSDNAAQSSDYGDFEDLETGTVYKKGVASHKTSPASTNNADNNNDDDHNNEKDDDNNDDDDGEKSGELGMGHNPISDRARMNLAKIEKIKRKKERRADLQKDENSDMVLQKGQEYFDALKHEFKTQKEINKEAFSHETEETRIQLEGYRAGLYVRIVFDKVPRAFFDHFDPNAPLLIGGLNPLEDQLGSITVRLKKHRWYPKILKNGDPITVSAGWRRFQTVSLYSMMDHNKRNRSIKYTPKNMHCISTFHAPIIPTGMGVLVYQHKKQLSLNNTIDHYPDNETKDEEESKSSDQEQSENVFRILATGVSLGSDQAVDIVKKLKLIGHPYAIFVKTAFVKGMFNSDLEVSKFTGAQLRTVSGIRGLIKRPLKEPAGAFRASFEDQLDPADVIFLRAWVPLRLPKFYLPVTEKLLPQGTIWSGMRTTGELRKVSNIPIPEPKPNSTYVSETVRKHFNVTAPKIPEEVLKNLPFEARNRLPSLLKQMFPDSPLPKALCQTSDAGSISNTPAFDELSASSMFATQTTRERKVSRLLSTLTDLKSEAIRTQHEAQRAKNEIAQKEKDAYKRKLDKNIKESRVAKFKLDAQRRAASEKKQAKRQKKE